MIAPIKALPLPRSTQLHNLTDGVGAIVPQLLVIRCFRLAATGTVEPKWVEIALQTQAVVDALQVMLFQRLTVGSLTIFPPPSLPAVSSSCKHYDCIISKFCSALLQLSWQQGGAKVQL